MSDNAIATTGSVFGSDLVNLDDPDRFVAAMEETVDEGARGGDVSYMSFSGKIGRISIGIDKRSIMEGEHFVVAPTMFSTGWICWKGGKPAAKRMAKLGQPKIQEPDPEELGPFSSQKDGWSKARGIVMKSLEKNEQIEFTNNSKSGVSVMADLQRDVLDRYKSGQPCVPIMHIGIDEFTSTAPDGSTNTNFKPVFDVVKWITPEELNQMADPDFDPLSLVGDADSDAKADEPPKPRRRL